MEFKENAKPIYLQIADRICDDVMAGTLQPQARIPSVREYAALVQVNVNTMMRAYDFLSQKGIIYNQRGIGFFICADAKEQITALRNEAFFQGEAAYFFSRLRSMGIEPQQLAQMYNDYLNTQQ